MPSPSRPVLSALFAALVACGGDAESDFDATLSRAPPETASASLEWLTSPNAHGNARLLMRFADGRRHTSLVIQGGIGPTALRDDGVEPDAQAGDGLYSAWVQANAAALAREQRRRAALARQVREVPDFQQRQLVGTRSFQPAAGMPEPTPGTRMTLEPFLGVPDTVDAERELLVRDLGVVEDPQRTYEPCTGAGMPMGAWTFGRLMTELANQPATGIHPADFAEAWMRQWMQNRTINGFVVPNRAVGTQAFLDGWPRDADGRLDLARAPFRLLAIVNRLDLRGNTLFGPSNSAEGRLVFGGVRCVPLPDLPPTETLGFTVAFEYVVPATDCTSTRAWAQQWHALGSLPLGSPAYNGALQAITDQFTLRNARPSRSPNFSALQQLRSNEFALADSPSEIFWELREARLARDGRLAHDTLAQTPHRSLQGSTTLRDFINSHEAKILAGGQGIPTQYPDGVPFVTGHFVQGAGLSWNADGINNLEARHRFSVGTCIGCHTLETDTRFVHIEPRGRGEVAALSNFLTGAGMPMSDPVSGVPRTFNDLLERRMKLDADANLTCESRNEVALEEVFMRPLAPAFAH